MLKKNVFCLLVLGLMGLMITGICSLASASQNNDSSWSLSLTEQRSTMPGVYVTLVANLQNTGSNEETLDIKVEEPTKWDLLPLPKSVTLAPGAEEFMFVSLNLPGDTLAGQYELIMKVSSQSGVETIKKAVVDVLRKRELTLVAGGLLHVPPGQTSVHSVTVYNLGNTPELVNLNFLLPDDWLIRSDLGKFLLNPGANQTVTFSVSVPKTAKPSYHSLTVDAFSADEQARTKLNLDVMVLPPTPDLVAELRPDALRASVYISTGNIHETGFRLGNARLTARGSVGEDTKIDLQSRVYTSKIQQSYKGRFDLNVEKLPWSFGFNAVPEAKDLTEHNYLLGYDQDPWSLCLGDVDRRLTPLIKLAGRGTTVDYSGKQKTNYSVIALDQAKGASINKKFGLTDWRFTYLSRGDELGDVLSAHSQIQISENMGIDGEIVNAGGHTSTALGATWQHGKLRGDGHYFWYGKNYLGAQGESTGYELNFFADFKEFTLALGLEKTKENLSEKNEIFTVENKVISLGTSIPMGSLVLDGFVQGKWLTTWRSDEVNSTNTDTLDTKFALNQRVSNWFWEISNETKVINDNIGGDQKASIFTKAVVGYNWDRVGMYAGYGLIGEGTTFKEARKKSYSAPLFGLSYYPETRLVDYVSLDYQGGNHPVLTLANQVGVDMKNSRVFLKSELKHKDKWEWNVRAGVTVGFDLPIPGVYSNGQIKGRIFVVDGGNKIGVGQVILKTKSTKVTTDADGYFKFPPVPPGVYEVTMENLPQNSLAALKLPLEIRVEAGEIYELAIPIDQVASISGLVRRELTSGFPYSTAPNLAGIIVELRQGKEVIQTVRTSNAGYYQFWNLEPGQYELAVVEKTLPKRHKITTTNPVTINLKPTERDKINFAIKEELTIITTYQSE